MEKSWTNVMPCRRRVGSAPVDLLLLLQSVEGVAATSWGWARSLELRLLVVSTRSKKPRRGEARSHDLGDLLGEIDGEEKQAAMGWGSSCCLCRRGEARSEEKQAATARDLLGEIGGGDLVGICWARSPARRARRASRDLGEIRIVTSLFRLVALFLLSLAMGRHVNFPILEPCRNMPKRLIFRNGGSINLLQANDTRT